MIPPRARVRSSDLATQRNRNATKYARIECSADQTTSTHPPHAKRRNANATQRIATKRVRNAGGAQSNLSCHALRRPVNGPHQDMHKALWRPYRGPKGAADAANSRRSTELKWGRREWRRAIIGAMCPDLGYTLKVAKPKRVHQTQWPCSAVGCPNPNIAQCRSRRWRGEWAGHSRGGGNGAEPASRQHPPFPSPSPAVPEPI